MNRWDEIKAKALDVAQHVTDNPRLREQMADDLIELIGLMVAAVGKGVAIEGETSMNEQSEEEPDPTAHGRYLLGEEMQLSAGLAVEESKSADLDRWKDLNDNAYGWHPRCRACQKRNDPTCRYCET